MMKRTPKYYNGTGPTGKRLGDLLPEVLKSIQTTSEQGADEVFKYWPELIGPSMAPLTEPISLIEGVLTVNVKSSTLYSLLCQHERPRLLRRLQEKFSIRNLVFRIG